MYKATVVFLLLHIFHVESATPNEGRIVGGRVVSISKHPYQISLRFKSCAMCSFSHTCGGVILNAKTILTAAHCIYKRDNNSFTVIAGSDNRAGSDGIISLIDKIIVHEQYNPAFLENDVALMFLPTPMVLMENIVWPAKLASQQPITGSKAWVSGWGAISEGGFNSNKLQEVEVNVIDRSVCKESYGFERITLDMLCAGISGGGKDACQNDSGGPLTSNGLLIGIVSWGNGCARPDFPGVYVNIAYLRQWIDKNMEENL